MESPCCCWGSGCSIGLLLLGHSGCLWLMTAWMPLEVSLPLNVPIRLDGGTRRAQGTLAGSAMWTAGIHHMLHDQRFCSCIGFAPDCVAVMIQHCNPFISASTRINDPHSQTPSVYHKWPFVPVIRNAHPVTSQRKAPQHQTLQLTLLQHAASRFSTHVHPTS
jgi:hypothetical protein